MQFVVLHLSVNRMTLALIPLTPPQWSRSQIIIAEAHQNWDGIEPLLTSSGSIPPQFCLIMVCYKVVISHACFNWDINTIPLKYELSLYKLNKAHFIHGALIFHSTCLHYHHIGYWISDCQPAKLAQQPEAIRDSTYLFQEQDASTTADDNFMTVYLCLRCWIFF